MRIWLLSALLGGLLAVAGCGTSPPALTPAEKLRQAQVAVQDQQYSQALQLVDELLEQSPRRADLLLLAADAATRSADYPRAFNYYERMRDDGSESFRLALFSAGDLHRHLGHMSLAEHYFREVLTRAPHEVVAIQRLGHVLNLSGRRWEATPWLLQQIQAGQYQPQDLLLLGNVERLSHNLEYIEQACQSAPEDPLPWLGLARTKLEAHEFDDAQPLLERALQLRPSLVEAQLQQGWWLWHTGQLTPLTTWLAQLSAETQRHPDYWVLQGLAAREQNQPQSAIRCFGEAVQRDPDHRLAVYHLGQLLREVEPQHPAITDIAQRAVWLQQLDEQLERLYSTPTEEARLMAVARLLLELGRGWEAAAWAQFARQQHADWVWPKEIILRAEQMVSAVPQAVSQRTVQLPPGMLTLDWSNHPLPTWNTRPAAPSETPEPSTVATIQFADVAADTGLHFQYYNDADAKTEGMRMLEFTGGGVGVIDFDLDGWPDLHMAQGSVWPPRDHAESYRDQLFRNRQGQQWSDVTQYSRIHEGHYSQGVAVGDFDSDGFPDLYVANIGRNALFLNRGDGTFHNATDDVGLGGIAWTTSVAIADLNQDGHPDLYDVNYLTGEGVYTQICQSGGVPRACVPTIFEGEPDALWLNTGDGRCQDISAAAGLNLPLGNGLGVLVADFDQQQQLDVFIANDAVANFLLVPEGSSPAPRFANLGVTSGLAFDRDGRAQACMGVACADADGNGQLDLFITNYYREANTLYLQEAPLLFNDRTAAYELRELSYLMLGFGTQFLDADLDTWPDLMLVNGHVDDFSHLGTPYRMRPQFFRNLQGQRFAELPAESSGDWFAQPQLGRAMARLDWNRDGLDDVAISHLDTPAALVTNQTPSGGNFLALTLHGVTTNRDAIGTRIEFQCQDRKIVSQMVAGDGYQASNERKLVLGLGTADRARHVQITWPDGSTQHWEELTGGQEYLIVQGRDPLVMSP